MGRGGKRQPREGKKLGRPKAQRLVDAFMAERILAKVEVEKLWLEAIEKARHSEKTYELVGILHYLEDRAMGRTVIRMANPEGEKFQLEIDVTAARNRLLGMLT